jgi:hypothetical protein
VKPLTVPALFSQSSGVLPEIVPVQLLAVAEPSLERPPPQIDEPPHEFVTMFVVPDRVSW